MRNPNGYGSIVNLGKGRRKPFAVRITVGWVDGKQQYKYLSYHSNRQDAMVELGRYNNEHYHIDSKRITFSEVYNQWLVHRKPNATKNLLAQYKMAFNASTKLHNMKFSDIRSYHMEDCINNSGYAKATLIKIKTLYNQLFNYAMEIDLANKNYAQFVMIDPSVGKSTKPKIVFAESTIERLWEMYEREQDYIVENILILLYSGMRIEELLCLELANINIEEQFMIGGIKTENGTDRTIPIHNKLVEIIKKRLETHKEFLWEYKGKRLTYAKARARFDKVMADLGVSHTPHETRHTFISRMDTAGVNIIITRMIAGHKQEGITAKVYIHKEVKELLENINKLN